MWVSTDCLSFIRQIWMKSEHDHPNQDSIQVLFDQIINHEKNSINNENKWKVTGDFSSHCYPLKSTLKCSPHYSLHLLSDCQCRDILTLSRRLQQLRPDNLNPLLSDAYHYYYFISQKWEKAKTASTALLADEVWGFLMAAPVWLPTFYCDLQEVIALWESH